MSEMDTVLYNAINDGKTVLQIDEKTRTITYPGGSLLLGVEGDINSHRLYFEIPSETVGDGIQLGADTVDIYIDFTNAEYTTCVCEATNKVTAEITTFDWLLDKRVAICNGKVEFRVRVTDTDAEGNIREWHTANFTATVLNGIDVDDKTPEVVTETSSIYALQQSVNETLAQVNSALEQANAVIDVANSAESTSSQAYELATDASSVAANASSVAANASSTANSANNTANTALTKVATLESYLEKNNLFDFKERYTINGNEYVDVKDMLTAFNELMIVVRIETNAETTIGISNATSGSTGFLSSVNVTAGTKYFKIIVNRTSDGYYGWTINGNNNCLFSWTNDANYGYIRNYVSDTTATVSMSVVVYGR